MRKQTKLWKTRDGEKVRICDMSHQHILNSIKMLNQMAKQETKRSLEVCRQLQGWLFGDEALARLEREELTLMEEGLDPSDIFPMYDNLVAEAARRGLKIPQD